MRLYEKGEKVLISESDEIGTVLERYDEPYKLPEGQALGGIPGATHGGHAHYRVKTKDGEIHELRDQDVRNPSKASGHYTAYETPEQKAEREARKARNRENVAKAKADADKAGTAAETKARKRSKP